MNNSTPQKIQIKLPAKFSDVARRFNLTPKYVAELACDLFADKPPVEIRIVSGGKVKRHILASAEIPDWSLTVRSSTWYSCCRAAC